MDEVLLPSGITHVDASNRDSKGRYSVVRLAKDLEAGLENAASVLVSTKDVWTGDVSVTVEVST